MIRIPDSEIERFLEEDAPYGDLTTDALGIGESRGKIVLTAREPMVACGTDEAARVLEMCGAHRGECKADGNFCAPGEVLLSAEGRAASLHAGWKVALNLVEYASGIATRTRRLVDSATGANPRVRVVTTRKSFPGTKKISLKAVLAGGGAIHRLGLSETCLVFRQHAAFLGGPKEWIHAIAGLKQRLPENMIVVEVESVEEAVRAASSEADVIQMDKIPADVMKDLVPRLRSIHPGVKLSATGGIHEGNAAQLAATGVDLLVLSSVYFGKPSDVAVSILPKG
jgi:molybdenum transport protein